MNLAALIDPARDIGLPGGRELLAYCDALTGADRKALDAARQTLAETLGPASVPAAAAIAANFSKNDRIANGCGIPVDPTVLKITVDLREELGLNDFRSAVNTFRHFDVNGQPAA